MDSAYDTYGGENAAQQIYQLIKVRKLGYLNVSLILDMDVEDVKRLYREENERLLEKAISEYPTPFFSKENTPDLQISYVVTPVDETTPWTINATNALVMSDFHCPHYNNTMLERAVQITKKYFPDVKDAIIAGDIGDFDGASIFPQTSPVKADMTKTLGAIGEVVMFVSDHYKTWITNGNHDERVAKRLNMPFHLRHLINAALGGAKPKNTVNVTNLDYIYLGDKWIVGHPSSYSSIGGRMPAEIADLEQRNVATGHNHIIGIQASKSGRYLGIDLGHMTDPTSHYYMTRRLTKYPRWNPGFLIIHNGYAYPFWDDKFTDWGKWL